MFSLSIAPVRQLIRPSLKGRFGMSAFVKVFLTFWFGVVAVVDVTTLLAAFNQSSSASWWLPLTPLGFLIAGAALVYFGKWLSRNDIAWLSGVIQRSLSPSIAQPGAAGDASAFASLRHRRT